jgi:hypothetical protein
MKWFQHVLVFLFAVFFLASCGKKKYHTVVTGKVINYGSKEPVAGVRVVLADGIATGGVNVGSTSSDAKSETFTDINGEFNIELTGNHITYLYLFKEGYSFSYSDGGASIGMRPYSAGSVNKNQVLELKAEAFFDGKFKILNGSKEDSLKIKVLEFDHNLGYYIENGFKRERDGVDHVYFHVPLILAGHTYFIYEADLKKNGHWNSKIDSVFIKSFETFKDTIYF